MSRRWFVVPMTSFTDGDGTSMTTPRFVGHGEPYHGDVEHWAGQPIDFSRWDSAPWDAQWYAVHVRAPTATLDAIEAESDAHTRQEHGISESDVAAWLNEFYLSTGASPRSFAEWEQFFLAE